MYTKIAVCFLASLCMTQAYVILNSQLYNSPPPSAYIPRSEVRPSGEYQLPPALAPVRSVSTVTHETPVVGKDEQSDETIIAGPSGVIKTHRQSSKPAVAQHTAKVTTSSVAQTQPITYLAPPIVRIEQDQIPNEFFYRNADFNPEAFLYQL